MLCGEYSELTFLFTEKQSNDKKQSDDNVLEVFGSYKDIKPTLEVAMGDKNMHQDLVHAIDDVDTPEMLKDLVHAIDDVGAPEQKNL